MDLYEPELAVAATLSWDYRPIQMTHIYVTRNLQQPIPMAIGNYAALVARSLGLVRCVLYGKTQPEFFPVVMTTELIER